MCFPVKIFPWTSQKIIIMTSFTGTQNKTLHKLVTHKKTQTIANILCTGWLKSHWQFCFVMLWNNIFYQNNKSSWWEFRLYHCWWSILVDWLRQHNRWKINNWVRSNCIKTRRLEVSCTRPRHDTMWFLLWGRGFMRFNAQTQLDWT